MAEPIELKRGERILISRFDRITDLILSIPLIETLKMRYPENLIDVIVSDNIAPLVKNIKHVDNTVIVDSVGIQNDKEYQKEFLGRLKQSQYQVAVVLYPDKTVSRLFYEAGIPYRIGTGKRFHSIYFNRHIFQNRNSNKKHESEYNLDFLRFFRQGVLFKIPKLDLNSRELDEARKLLTLDGIKTDFVILHPGSGVSPDSWPLELFVELSDLLNKKNFIVLMTGTSEEGIVINQVASKNGIKIRSFAGKTDLITLAALMSMARTVVANSSGPLYLAAAVGTNVVGIYPSGRVISSIRWGALGEDFQIIRPYAGSSIKTITVEEVAATVLNSLHIVKAEK